MGALLGRFKDLLIGEGAPRPIVLEPAVTKTTDYQLIKQESEIGRTLFGDNMEGKSREFFCLDPTTWVWYEQWRDENGISKSQTIRYEIHPKGILKVEDGGKSYHFLETEELETLADATTLYYERVKRELYQSVAYTL